MYKLQKLRANHAMWRSLQMPQFEENLSSISWQMEVVDIEVLKQLHSFPLLLVELFKKD